MATKLTSITASPSTLAPGRAATITVNAVADPDKVYRIQGVVVGETNPDGSPKQAEVNVTLDNPPLSFSHDPATAKPGDVLVTAPDGGTLVPVSGQPGRYTFTP